MTYYLARLLINTLAVIFTVGVTPGIRLVPAEGIPLPDPLVIVVEYLFLGFLFGVINAIVRPGILLITGRLVISTLGLFIPVVNGLLFYLVSVLSETLLIQAPVWFWLIIAGLLMSLAMVVLDAVFGLNSPLVKEEQTSRFYWRWFERLPSGRRNWIAENLRLMQVYDTIWRFVAEIVMSQTPLRRFRRWMQRILYPPERVIVEDSVPALVRLMLQELGPTYVKLGQMAASRSEALPEDWSAELALLQNKVATFPFAEVQRIVHQELGGLPAELYTTFDPNPLAAASLAQIHRARLDGGQEVVVKVQRPDVQVTVRADLNVIHDGVGTLERRFGWFRRFGLSGMLEEFSRGVHEEMDYRNEAYHARRLKEEMREFDYVLVPEVFAELSTSKVMTMEFVSGVRITKIEDLDRAGVDRANLARDFMRVMNKQVLLDGFFHGDPHPGNILYDLDQHKIIFLDLGLMGQMNTAQRMAFFDVIWTLKEGDSKHLTKLLLQVCTRTLPLDEQALQRDLDRLVGRYITYAGTVPLLSEIVQEALGLLYRYGLQLDSTFTLALKGLVQAEEIIRLLAPELPFLEAAIEEVQTLLLSQLEGETLAEKVKEQAFHSARTIFFRLPALQASAERWLEQFESGKLTLHIDTQDLNFRLEQVESSVARSVRQLVLGFLIVGMLIGTAIVSLVPLDQLVFLDVIPYDIFILVFALAAVLAVGYFIYMIWAAWQQRRRRKSSPYSGERG